MKDTLARLIGTVGYVGYMKPAPGTWGSIAALPLAWLIYQIGGIYLFLLAIPVTYVKGYWATIQMTHGQDDHDPSEIVIDEVVGQWIALAPVVIGAHMQGANVLALWPGWIAALVFFRLYDITKPGPVGWADRKNNATGVMLDDVIAGVFAAICVIAVAGFAHRVMM